jgi:hydrogenase large subunit
VDEGKYTWVKAPRFEGKPMQVGPLANVLVGYAQSHALTRKWTDGAMLAELALGHWENLVNNISRGDTTSFNAPSFPKGAIEGVGLHEAPRGTLSHWVVIKNGILSNYQAVVPRVRTRPPSSGPRSPTPNGPRRCSGPCTPSTRAWPAPATPWTRRAARSRR